MAGSLSLTQDHHTSLCGPVCRPLSPSCTKGISNLQPGAKPTTETTIHRSTRTRHVLQAWRGAEDADIAVFRFTLGIPGFNDALLPRLVGILGAALLVANHLSDQGTATGAQVRTEGLGAALSALCIATPSIGARLQAAQPGRGRTAGNAGQSSGQVFQIATDQPDDAKTELAWASYSLLRNTNSSGLLVASSSGKVMVLRGAVRRAAGPGKGQSALDEMQKDLQEAVDGSSSLLTEAMSSTSGPVYLPDASAVAWAGLSGALLPDSTCSALVQPLRPLPMSASSGGGAWEPAGGAPSSSSGHSESQARTDMSGNGSSGGGPDRGEAPAAGILMLWSDRPRALSQKERLWAAAIAAKLCETLS